jgi:hypothetical protein
LLIHNEGAGPLGWIVRDLLGRPRIEASLARLFRHLSRHASARRIAQAIVMASFGAPLWAGLEHLTDLQVDWRLRLGISALSLLGSVLVVEIPAVVARAHDKRRWVIDQQIGQAIYVVALNASNNRGGRLKSTDMSAKIDEALKERGEVQIFSPNLAYFLADMWKADRKGSGANEHGRNGGGDRPPRRPAATSTV